MKLFLRWAILNSAATLILAAGAIHYWARLHGIALLVIPVILARAATGSGYAGWLCWQLENPDRADWVRHRLEHIRSAAWECQMVAIMGTALGFYDVLSGHGDVFKRVQQGAGAAVLLGTFTGVLGSMLLERAHRLLEHQLGA